MSAEVEMSTDQVENEAVETQLETLAPPPGMVSHWCVTEKEFTKVDFEWAIERLGFLKPCENWGSLESSLFSNGKTRNPEWSLNLYDIGSDIDITVNIPSQDQTGSPVRVKMAILNKKRQKIFPEEHCFPANTELPCVVFQMEKSQLFESECFVNGKLTIYCEIVNFHLMNPTFRSGKSSAVADNHEKPFSNSDQLVAHLEELFENEKYSDITINVCGREFKAHKNILASRSSVFSAMFDHPTKENLTNRVEIKDVDPDVFHDILRYIYTGRVSKTAMEKKPTGILAVADKYLLDQLKMECETQLIHRMTAENCLSLLLVTNENHPAFNLRKYAVEFFRRFSGEVMATDGWENAKKDHPELCISLLEELVKSFVLI